MDDPARRLTWMADSAYVVTSGLSEEIVMPRARALEVLARLNAGEVENFGYADWRLPTAWELRHMVAVERRGLSNLPDAELALLEAWLAVALERTAAAGDPQAARVAELVPLWPVRGGGIEAGFSDVAIFATNSVRLKNRAMVTSGDVVVNDASAGPTLLAGYELGMDPFASTPAGFAIKGDSVWIKNRAIAGGDVAYNELRNQGTIGGSESSPLPLPVFAVLPLFFAQPPAASAEDVTVGEGGFVALPPGDYGDVQVGEGGTLEFQGGIYNLRSITAAEDASLLFVSAAEVRVEERFKSDHDVTIGPEDGSGVSAHDLVLYVAGINGTDGDLGSTPLAAEIGNGNQVGVNFYVPNGTLRVGHDTNATGAFLGLDVLVENQAQVALDSYFFNRPPEPADDSATASQGGTVSILDSGEASLLGNDTDPNGDALTVTTTPVSGPSHGTLTLNADGTFSYTHDGSDTESDGFVYEVCDDSAPVLCATATVSITLAPEITVTVVRFGLGEGRVTSTPAGIDCGDVCSAIFQPSGSVVLSAEPFGESVFGGFSGDPDCADGTLSPDADKLCLARFDLSAEPALLSVTLAGTGSGLVTSDPAGIGCPGDCSESYPIPSRVDLAASPSTGSTFVGWGGDEDCSDGVLDLFGDAACIATFELIPPPPPSFTLTLDFQGGGSGTVISVPAGVFCEVDCAASFPQGTELALSARPFEGSFGGWGGDCSGVDISTTVTLDADKLCTVTFLP